MIRAFALYAVGSVVFLVLLYSLPSWNMSSEAAAKAGEELATAASQVVNETLKKANETFQATPQGQAVAYSSLVVMALLPIFYGSFRSVKQVSNQEWCYVSICFISALS